MSLMVDRFVQTLLYGELLERGDTPIKGFKIYEDATMSYENKHGQVREVEVTEESPGVLLIKAFDVKDNSCVHHFKAKYDKMKCRQCNCNTIHGIREKVVYCLECGEIIR